MHSDSLTFIETNENYRQITRNTKSKASTHQLKSLKYKTMFLDYGDNQI